MKTKATMTIYPANYTPFTRIRANCPAIDKIGPAICRETHESRDMSCPNSRLRFWPDVAPHQCLGEGPAGKTGKQKNKNSTTEANKCMKTREAQQKCPKKVGCFCLSF